MPTYEYICAKCGHEFDFSQSIKDDALKICPKESCKLAKWGKGAVKRGISAGAGLIFKGSGFYITDYRSENYKEGAKKESGAATPAKTETKSETKSPASDKSGGTAAATTPAPAKSEAKPAPKSSSKE